jgi:hypothetical protein
MINSMPLASPAVRDMGLASTKVGRHAENPRQFVGATHLDIKGVSTQPMTF